MKEARMWRTVGGGLAWDANYAEGGRDFLEVSRQNRLARALDSYSEINKLHGVTCEDDIWNCVVRKKKPALVEYRKTLGQRVKEWFTEVVEE